MDRDHAARNDAWNDRPMARYELARPPRGALRERPRRRLAGRAAERAGWSSGPDTLPELEEAGSRLIARIWDDEDGDPKAPTSLLRALAHAGNWVAGAFYGDGELVGVSFGFFGLERVGATPPLAHHGRRARALQSRSIGFALKQFQRSWALERDARTIGGRPTRSCAATRSSTSSSSGPRSSRYHENFYGVLQDGLNAGDSDRVLLRSGISPRSALSARPTDRPLEPGAGEGRRRPARGRGRRARDQRTERRRAARLAARRSIVSIRERRSRRASAWRLALRETVGRALAGEFRADTITRDGWLVLRR